MGIKTVKTEYYYALLDGIKMGRSTKRTKPPTGEYDLINLKQNPNPGETGSNSSILRQAAEPGYNTMPISQLKSIPPSNPRKLGKKTGKFQTFIRNLSLGYGKKVIKNFPLAKLVFQNGKLAGKKFFIYNVNPPENPGGYIKIGRIAPKGERFFIKVPDSTVSRTHAKIVYLNGKLIIVNYSSTNPTRLNGKPIQVNASAYITNGADIKIGEYELVIEKIKFA